MTPIRVYAEYNGITVVDDLLAAGASGGKSADYIYKQGKLLEVVIKMPVKIANLVEANSGIVFKAVDQNNIPVKGVTFSGEISVVPTGNFSIAKVPFSVSSEENGTVVLSQKDIEEKVKAAYKGKGINYSKGVSVTYNWSYNDTINNTKEAAKFVELANVSHNYTTNKDESGMRAAAEVVYVNTTLPASAIGISFKLAEEKTYKAGDKVEAVFSFTGDDNSKLSINRTTNDPVSLRLSNGLGFDLNFPESTVEAETSFIDTKKSGSTYEYEFVLPSDIQPGSYKLTGNIINLGRVFDPLYVTIVK